jgi:hypothetical protein
MKKLILLATLLSALLVPPAAAQAVPYLSAGEAARVTGGALHREYTNVMRGSLDARCPATRRPNVRVCSYSYLDLAGTCWWGDTKVWETRTHYYWRILFDDKCH